MILYGLMFLLWLAVFIVVFRVLWWKGGTLDSDVLKPDYDNMFRDLAENHPQFPNPGGFVHPPNKGE